MRPLLTDAHIGLFGSIRKIIANDPLLAGWIAKPPDIEGEGHHGVASGLVVESGQSTPWASLTFTGMRHSLDIRLIGEEAHVVTAYERLKWLLDEPAIELTGHFLADLVVVDSLGEVSTDGRLDLRVRIEALTIRE